MTKNKELQGEVFPLDIYFYDRQQGQLDDLGIGSENVLAALVTRRMTVNQREKMKMEEAAQSSLPK